MHNIQVSRQNTTRILPPFLQAYYLLYTCPHHHQYSFPKYIPPQQYSSTFSSLIEIYSPDQVFKSEGKSSLHLVMCLEPMKKLKRTSLPLNCCSLSLGSDKCQKRQIQSFRCAETVSKSCSFVDYHWWRFGPPIPLLSTPLLPPMYSTAV